MRHGEELDAVSAGAEHLMRGMERRMMEELVRMLRRNAGSVTAASDYLVNRAHELSVSKQAVQEILRETAAEFSRAVDEVYDEALKADYTRCGDLYRAQGKQQIPYEENAALQQLIGAVKAQTNGAFQNITATTGFIDKDGNFTLFADYWQQTLDTAAMDVLSGTIPYEKALDRITRELTNSGLRTVDYASGHKDRVEVAARRALLTGVNQVVTHITEEQMDELNTPYVEVEWHGTARPEHQVWQGKIYYWAERDRARGEADRPAAPSGDSPQQREKNALGLLTNAAGSGTMETAEERDKNAARRRYDAMTREQCVEVIRRGIREPDATFSYDTAESHAMEYLRKAEPMPNAFDVRSHGTDSLIEFFKQDYPKDDIRSHIDAYTLASILRGRKDFRKFIADCKERAVEPVVRLMSCSTGDTANTGNCFAQLLANELGICVLAPTDILYANPDGSVYVGDFQDGHFQDFIGRM